MTLPMTLTQPQRSVSMMQHKADNKVAVPTARGPLSIDKSATGTATMGSASMELKGDDTQSQLQLQSQGQAQEQGSKQVANISSMMPDHGEANQKILITGDNLFMSGISWRLRWGNLIKELDNDMDMKTSRSFITTIHHDCTGVGVIEAYRPLDNVVLTKARYTVITITDIPVIYRLTYDTLTGLICLFGKNYRRIGTIVQLQYQQLHQPILEYSRRNNANTNNNSIVDNSSGLVTQLITNVNVIDSEILSFVFPRDIMCSTYISIKCNDLMSAPITYTPPFPSSTIPIPSPSSYPAATGLHAHTPLVSDVPSSSDYITGATSSLGTTGTLAGTSRTKAVLTGGINVAALSSVSSNPVGASSSIPSRKRELPLSSVDQMAKTRASSPKR
jgi:hypothetical protein